VRGRSPVRYDGVPEVALSTGEVGEGGRTGRVSSEGGCGVGNHAIYEMRRQGGMAAVLKQVEVWWRHVDEWWQLRLMETSDSARQSR
jgi:hypothetical protein